MREENVTSEVKANSYPAFLDIDDRELRLHNQAAIMRNILEDHSVVTKKGERVTARGAAISMDYFGKIPKADQKELLKRVADLQVNAGRVVKMH